MERTAIIKALEAVFDAYEVWEISISSRPLIIEHIANMMETERDQATEKILDHLSYTQEGRKILEEITQSELSFDEAEARGLDGTLRS